MSTYIPKALRRQVRERFGNCCAYCRTAESLTVTTFEFEHIFPQSAGGENTFENLCLACPTCNRHKATKQTVDDLQTGETVPIFHPQQQVWEEHFAWSQDAASIVGKTAIGRATSYALKMNRPQLIRVRRLWVKLGEHPP